MMNEEARIDPKCQFIFTEPAAQYRLTNIIATISQSSQDPEILMQMALAGMTVARLNFSHDNQKFHEKTIQMLRDVSDRCSKELGRTMQLAIALDTKGPEIRTGFLDGGPYAEIEIRANDSIRLSTNRDLMDKGNRDFIYVDYEQLIDVLFPGSVVFINDGALELVVKELGVDCVICQVIRGGMLGSRKKVHFPGARVDLPAVSEKDRNDLQFALKHDLDFIFASSIRSAEAIKEIRSVLGDKGKTVKIIAKLDSLQGLENIDAILSAADGILFDRADVAIEIPPPKVLLAQKAITSHCNRLGKPIIVASNLLPTMRYKATPARSEIADLGNAVLDGADCVMLSAETAIGKYPVESVAMMSQIVREFELTLWHRQDIKRIRSISSSFGADAIQALAHTAVETASKTSANAIIVLTTSGKSAYLLASFRPRCPILAVTRCSRAFRQSYLYRGVIPILYTGRWCISNKIYLAYTWYVYSFFYTQTKPTTIGQTMWMLECDTL